MRDKKQSSITQERIDLLNQLDFAWNAQEAAWSRHMQDLRCFSSEHGHCHVPLNYEKYPKLGLWVKEQRRHYTLMKQKKSSHMTVERCAELTTLGFCYDTHESTWMERWRELAAFKEKTGSCVVPSNHYNTKLATWVHHQRRQYKRYTAGHACHITSDRIRRLDQLEFVWNPRQSTSDAEEESSSEEERAGEISASDDDETDRSEEEESEPSPRRTPKKRSRRV